MNVNNGTMDDEYGILNIEAMFDKQTIQDTIKYNNKNIRSAYELNLETNETGKCWGCEINRFSQLKIESSCR